MNKIKKTVTIISALFFLGTAVFSCKDDPLPFTETIASSTYVGEWAGLSTTIRSFTANALIERTIALDSTLSLRQESGKDTFNLRRTSTGVIILSGTWFITQVNDDGNAALNGARLLRLRVISSATRINYNTYTIKQLDSKNLLLYDGANRTFTFSK